MRILITGGTGFVGRYLVERLGPDHELALLAFPGEKTPPGVKVFRGDLTRVETLAEAAAWPEAVIHGAGLLRSLKDEGYFRVNAQGTRHLVESLKSVNPGLRHLILFSSLMAGGLATAADRPLTERDPARPEGAYGKSKAEAEAIVAASGLPHTIFRITSIYGAGSSEYQEFFAFAKRGLAPRLGAGEKWFSLVHVADVAEASARVLQAPPGPANLFYLADGGIVTMTEMVASIQRHYPRPLRRITVPGLALRAVAWMQEASGHLTGKAPVLDRSKARILLHPYLVCSSRAFTAAYPDFRFRPLDAGIEEMYLEYKARGLA